MRDELLCGIEWEPWDSKNIHRCTHHQLASQATKLGELERRQLGETKRVFCLSNHDDMRVCNIGTLQKV